jgi:hypothetical protein
LPLTPEQIAALRPGRLGDDMLFRAGAFSLRIPKGTYLRISDQVMLFTIGSSLPNRPVTFGQLSGRGAWLGLDSQLVFQGLVFTVVPGADTVSHWMRGIQRTRVDTARTRLLVDSVFEYGKLFSVDTLQLEPAAELVARSFALPYLELAQAARLRGDSARADAYLRRAYHLNPRLRR